MIKIRIIKKKIKELIKDESMATDEYKSLYDKDKTTYTIKGVRTNFLTMSQDENRHKLFLEKYDKNKK